jgi:hypothetical protein
MRKETEYIQEEQRIHKGGERILMASPAAYVPSRFLCIYTPSIASTSHAASYPSIEDDVGPGRGDDKSRNVG